MTSEISRRDFLKLATLGIGAGLLKACGIRGEREPSEKGQFNVAPTEVKPTFTPSPTSTPTKEPTPTPMPDPDVVKLARDLYQKGELSVVDGIRKGTVKWYDMEIKVDVEKKLRLIEERMKAQGLSPQFYSFDCIVGEKGWVLEIRDNENSLLWAAKDSGEGYYLDPNTVGEGTSFVKLYPTKIGLDENEELRLTMAGNIPVAVVVDSQGYIVGVFDPERGEVVREGFLSEKEIARSKLRELIPNFLARKDFWIKAGVPAEVWKRWEREAQEGSLSPDFETFVTQAQVINNLLGDGSIQWSVDGKKLSSEELSFRVGFDQESMPFVYLTSSDGGRLFITSVAAPFDNDAYRPEAKFLLRYKKMGAYIFEVPPLGSYRPEVFGFDKALYRDGEGKPFVKATARNFLIGLHLVCSTNYKRGELYRELHLTGDRLPRSLVSGPSVAVFTAAGDGSSQKMVGLDSMTDRDIRRAVLTIGRIGQVWSDNNELMPLKSFFGDLLWFPLNTKSGEMRYVYRRERRGLVKIDAVSFPIWGTKYVNTMVANLLALGVLRQLELEGRIRKPNHPLVMRLSQIQEMVKKYPDFDSLLQSARKNDGNVDNGEVLPALIVIWIEDHLYNLYGE